MGKSKGSKDCMGKIASSVLLKLSVNGNERCHTTDVPKHMRGALFSIVNTQSMIPEKDNYTMMQFKGVL